MEQKKVLIVEDEELMRSILRRLLEGEGYKVVTADSAELALQLYAENTFDVTITDVKMAGMDGIELLDKIKSLESYALVIIMTAYSSVDSAVAALRKGAFDYVTKPFVNEDLLRTIKIAIDQRELFNQNRALRRELNRHYSFSEMIGQSSALKQVFAMVEKVADTSANVLILGESGTGKELVARSIHFNSGRSARPFLAVNCGALSESLLESELFGHVKGSFTGAVADKKGLFRSAEGGTILLDEIGEMPVALQVKLLRALQEREVTPVGSSASVAFDARIISATHRDLEAEITAGSFREDLYYRLNVVEITIPPLRERADDIPLLARYFVSAAARSQNLPEKEIAPHALTALSRFEWPGNVRELENAMHRAFILSDDVIDVESLPAKVNKRGDMGTPAHRTLDEVERDHVLSTLSGAQDDKVLAAKLLGIDLSTLYRKLKRYQEE